MGALWERKMSEPEDCVRVKICGLTRPADAELAAGLGAWALGVIFAPESPRRVSLEQAAAVLEAAPAGVERIGVFVNAGVEEIKTAAEGCGLTAVQLHGEESAAECAEVGGSCGCRVIKALRVSGPRSLEAVVRFDTEYLLLDTYHPGQRGGTGKAFDWELTRRLPQRMRSSRVILSGGLNPDNILAAMGAVTPFAVDISSGVESKPGIKDEEKMRRLFKVIRESGGEGR